MQCAISVNGQQISIKEYNGQRVTTFKDIDQIHKRPDGTARNAFSRNRKKFVEGIDYFLVKSGDASMYGSRTLEVPPKGITLLTESGYLMLVKVFDDPLAWQVQRALVDNYFHAKPKEPTPFPYTWRGEPVVPISGAAALLGGKVSVDAIRRYLTKPPFTKRRDYFGLVGNDLWEFKQENRSFPQSIPHIILITKSGMEKLSRSLGLELRKDMMLETSEPEKASLPAPKKPSSQSGMPQTELLDAIGSLREKTSALNAMLEFVKKEIESSAHPEKTVERVRMIKDFAISAISGLIVLEMHCGEGK